MALKKKILRKPGSARVWVAGMLLVSVLFGHAGCFLNAKVEPYYGRIVVPRSQEFRWSDGGLPQTFDPAFAAAPPDTDLVRAIFEGLTDYDARTLKPVPGVATRWEPSNGGRVWTFYLRADARWTNGEIVTANDFVRSWQRTLKIGDLAPHTELLANIKGPAEAVSKSVLRVRLRRPDMNFPALVAHPVFRPVKLDDGETTRELAPGNLVSNGAFSLSKNESKRVLLERANNYWDKEQVTLERVEFVDQMDAESALAAYHDGEVDAVTNAALEPLAIKLLKPYEDFRRTTYGALTYYTFNKAQAPFDDVRVREALALAIDRDRISSDDLGGATEPAKRFLPDAISEPAKPVVGKSELLEKDTLRAKELLAEAGFPDGKGFPRVRLLVNRNEQQRTVAQAVAAMWRTALNVETEIVVKNWDEYEQAIRLGEFDVVRRGVVIQTTDELTNMRMIFHDRLSATDHDATSGLPSGNEAGARNGGAALANEDKGGASERLETESQALNDLSAMPIYFASSYALVKPYVTGFDSNVLDAPSLKTVRINANWKQPEPTGSTWNK
ncbi:MAG: peptide ABC transporter substrate-binding protein [Pyrinomonadaceae bacterium]|nr:peptide ABC transporter substrate-binding protein [Pyrinomonadaceae bacterium]